MDHDFFFLYRSCFNGTFKVQFGCHLFNLEFLSFFFVQQWFEVFFFQPKLLGVYCSRSGEGFGPASRLESQDHSPMSYSASNSCPGE